MARLRNSHDATLGEPTEGDLSGSLIILGTDSSQQIVLHDAVCSLSTEWIPSHHLGAKLAKNRLNSSLLRKRVALQLVHHRLQVYVVCEVEETACLEVAHTDSTNLACTIGLLHSPPRTEYVAIGLMDEQQVDILRLQLAQALINALGSLFLTSIGYPDLCYKEQIFALDATFAPSIANALLILVGLCRINQAIAYT